MMDIAEVVRSGQDKSAMLRRSLELTVQLYTDRTHLIYELLQNAEDAEATRIQFVQQDDRLIVRHNGHPFSVIELEGLCNVGLSSKTDDLNKIGEFGVGFKSVFSICEEVLLYSRPEHYSLPVGNDCLDFSIKIQDFTEPVNIQPKNIPQNYTTQFEFPYSVGNSFSGFDSVVELKKQLSHRLSGLDETVLLFLRHLKEIEYKIECDNVQNTGYYRLKEERINDHCSIIYPDAQSENAGEPKKAFLKFSRAAENTNNSRTIDIAFYVEQKDDGQYVFLETDHPYISVYFPTGTESKLKFIVQGPYRTTPDRNSIPEDDLDNIALAKQTSKLLCDSIKELKAEGKLTLDFLRLMPMNYSFHPNLFSAFYEDYLSLVLSAEIIPYAGEQYTDAAHSLIARGKDLIKIFPDGTISELFSRSEGDAEQFHWLPAEITENNKKYAELYYFFTYKLKIKVVRADDSLCKRLNESFLCRRDDEWLASFYNILTDSSLDRNSKLIKVESGEFVSVNEENLYLRPKSEEDFSMDEISAKFVSEELYQRCPNFFDHVAKIERFDASDWIVENLKLKYSNNNAPKNKGDLINDTKRILRMNLESRVRSIPMILCDDGILRAQPWFPATKTGLSAKLLYTNINIWYSRYSYVDLEFYQQNEISQSNLEELGVQWPNLTYRGEIRGNYTTGDIGRPPQYICVSPFWWNMEIRKLSDILAYIRENPSDDNSKEKSRILWKLLLENEPHLKGTIVIGKDRSEKAMTAKVLDNLKYDYGYWGRRKRGWLYTTSGELAWPKEISKYDLDKNIYGEIPKDKTLYILLGFKRDVRDQEEQDAERYHMLSSNQKDAYWKFMLRERLGMSEEEFNCRMEQDRERERANSIENDAIDENEEHISRPVRDLSKLRTHAKNVFYNAQKVRYEEKSRRERVTRKEDEERGYLTEFYALQGKLGYICQMCGKSKEYFESCELLNEPQKELPPMNLCLCLDCAMKFRAIRREKAGMEKFLSEICGVTDTDLADDYPIRVPLDHTNDITFSQTHLAEIKELLKLQEYGEQKE